MIYTTKTTIKPISYSLLYLYTFYNYYIYIAYFDINHLLLLYYVLYLMYDHVLLFFYFMIILHGYYLNYHDHVLNA